MKYLKFILRNGRTRLKLARYIYFRDKIYLRSHDGADHLYGEYMHSRLIGSKSCFPDAGKTSLKDISHVPKMRNPPPKE